MNDESPYVEKANSASQNFICDDETTRIKRFRYSGVNTLPIDHCGVERISGISVDSAENRLHRMISLSKSKERKRVQLS